MGNFTHPAMEILVKSFFYEKEKSVGQALADTVDFDNVPNAVLALSACAVRQFLYHPYRADTQF